MKKLIKIELILLLILSIAAVIVIRNDYISRPGILEKDTLKVSEKGTDSVSLEWQPVRNAKEYVVSYKEKDSDDWKEQVVEGDRKNTTVKGLKEGTDYDFTIKANSEEREGHTIETAETTTKKHQSIEGKTKQMKLASTDVDLNLNSETNVEITPQDESVAEVNDNKLALKVPGNVTVTATAVASDEYAEEAIEVEIEVLDSVSEDTDSAKIHTIYTLNESNCEKIKTVTGTKEADVPQSLAYNGSEYVVAYGMSGQKRIITFGDEKFVEIPQVDLGHPNGFTYCDKNGKYYSVRGFSTQCIIWDPAEEIYNSTDLKYGASGIAYDKVNNKFYTSAQNALVVYSEDLELEQVFAPVKHKGTYYNQDCGGYSGIIMKCLSGKNKHGINLIDLYDSVNEKYLGTIECDLSEVESAAVDDDGYMILLCNTTNEKDYIYKTPINIDDIGQEFRIESDERESTDKVQSRNVQ